MIISFQASGGMYIHMLQLHMIQYLLTYTFLITLTKYFADLNVRILNSYYIYYNSNEWSHQSVIKTIK